LSDPKAIVDAHARSRRADPLQELVHGEPVTESERQSVLADFSKQLSEK
jgi:hypothetical protein